MSGRKYVELVDDLTLLSLQVNHMIGLVQVITTDDVNVEAYKDQLQPRQPMTSQQRDKFRVTTVRRHCHTRPRTTRRSRLHNYTSVTTLHHDCQLLTLASIARPSQSLS